MTYAKVHLDRCIEVAGEDRTGRFLHRLVRWQPHTRIIRDGRRWVAWSRARWEQELHLTPQQFRLVLEKLAGCEPPLILRKRYLHHGKATMHVALSDECAIRLVHGLKHPDTIGSKHPDGIGSFHPDVYKNPKKEPGESTKLAVGFAAANSEKVCIPEKNSYPEEVGNVIILPKAQGGADMTTAAEIAAQFAAAKPKPIDTLKPDKVASLVSVWQQSGKLVPSFTKKDLGQLKYLIGKWPAGKSPEILQFVLGHWYEVTEAIETNTTKFNSPASPDLGYLVKYQNIALTCFLKSKMKAASSPIRTPSCSCPVLHLASCKKRATRRSSSARCRCSKVAKARRASSRSTGISIGRPTFRRSFRTARNRSKNCTSSSDLVCILAGSS
jgi:hypothetical protein